MAENVTLYERMATFEEQQKNMSRDISEIKTSVKEIQVSFQAMTVQNDTRYAPKSTETTVNAGIGIILTAVILAVLALVIKKKK